jgi:TM2 domain-containing membrane protein YozV
VDQTKRCPLCGEVILSVAVRCRFCQADLAQTQTSPRAAGTPAPSSATPVQQVLRNAAEGPPRTMEEFEQRFLEFAFNTDCVINAPAVAYALKMPIDDALENLEDLAARDVLVREVDARGFLFFHLPGRQQVRSGVPSSAGAGSSGPYATTGTTALSPYAPQSMESREAALANAPSEGTALAGLLVNTLCLPGLGSIIGGRTSTGIGQMLLFLIGCLLLIFVVGAPMILSAWIWGLVTGIDVMNQAKLAQAQRRAQLGPPTL